jgi:MFS family permease
MAEVSPESDGSIISRSDKKLVFAHALLKVGWALTFGLTNTARTAKLLDLCKHDMQTLNFCNTVLWTSGNLSIALVSPLIGALSDAFGRVPILLMGRMGLTLWLVGTSASRKLWQFMLADWITWGLISASTQAVEDAFFADAFGERPQLSGRIRAQNGVWAGIAGFVSPFAGIWLASKSRTVTFTLVPSRYFSSAPSACGMARLFRCPSASPSPWTVSTLLNLSFCCSTTDRDCAAWGRALPATLAVPRAGARRKLTSLDPSV